jgi:DNA-binding NarL/FixJ family response regulator
MEYRCAKCQVRLSDLDRLSPREREVAEAYATGLRNKDVAVKLSMSPKTVYTHKSRIMTKLELMDGLDWVDFLVGVRMRQDGTEVAEGAANVD